MCDGGGGRWVEQRALLKMIGAGMVVCRDHY